MSYNCVECSCETDKGAMLGYADGGFVMVALCAVHMDSMIRKMAKLGVPTHDAQRLN